MNVYINFLVSAVINLFPYKFTKIRDLTLTGSVWTQESNWPAKKSLRNHNVNVYTQYDC